MSLFFLGIDIGTSGIRCCVINRQSQVISFEQQTFAPAQANNPEHWWHLLQQLLHQLQQNNLCRNIIAISIDGTSGTLIALDKKQQLLGKALMYFENPSPASNPCLPPGLQRLLYLKQQYPNLAHIAHQADWAGGKLSGCFTFSDWHNALKSGYDPQQQQWTEASLEAFPDKQLPQVFAPGSKLLPIHPEIIRQFGFHPSACLYAGTTDANAAFMASGATEYGEAMTALGTTLVLKILSPIRIDQAKYGIYSHKYNQGWLVSGASNCGAGILKQFFSEPEIQQLSQKINPDSLTGLNYYPLIGKGERFPQNDPNKQPVLSPKTNNKTRFFQAILEGLARVEKQGYQLFRHLGAPKVKCIYSSGGGAKNQNWQSLREQISGYKITLAQNEQAAFGTALLAQKGYNAQEKL